MGAYYYLAAQLPFLMFGQKPPMSSSEFKDLSLTQLSEEDSLLMEHLSLDLGGAAEKASSTGCDFIDGWRDWERTLRLNLAKHRAVKSKRDNVQAAEPPVVPADAAGASVRAVNSAATPLDGELIIDKARWDAICELAGNDSFDRNNVFAYFLKLLLLERQQSFNAEKGFTEYKSLYNSIMEEAQYMGEPK